MHEEYTMKIESVLSAQEYLSELKKHRFHRPDDLSKLSIHSVGPFFGITRRVYVSGENIRKHTFINSAFGYVRNSSDGWQAICQGCFPFGNVGAAITARTALPVFCRW